jgi:predicted TIM-barrel fold metal-dependent hydrolase
MTQPYIIDVHSHCPSAALEKLTGVPPWRSTVNVPWAPSDTLAMMDRTAIASSTLSLTTALDAVPPRQRPSTARAINEELARIVNLDPNRLGAFAVLPWTDADAAIVEADYALEVLHLDGIGSTTSISGLYLGDPRFLPIFDHLNSRRAVIFIHPHSLEHAPVVAPGIDQSTLEFMFESSRMVTSLIYSGVIRRCRDLRIISTHGGGAIPYLAHRIATHAETRNARRIVPMTYADVMADIATFYFDLTATVHAAPLHAILELVPLSHLLMGFDFPIRPERLFLPDLASLSCYVDLEPDACHAILRDNALRLFPRFGGTTGSEAVTRSADSHES